MLRPTGRTGGAAVRGKLEGVIGSRHTAGPAGGARRVQRRAGAVGVVPLIPVIGRYEDLRNAVARDTRVVAGKRRHAVVIGMGMHETRRQQRRQKGADAGKQAEGAPPPSRRRGHASLRCVS
ncbi:MAG: hypothetical protein L6R19_04750 [Alphaproteobacteria bacterium]|nr:hypothetical protein [Alphaproteobacteria bacterium]